MKKLVSILVIVSFVVLSASLFSREQSWEERMREAHEGMELRDVWDNNFPLGYNSMFTGSGECVECHGKGHGANEDSTGMNVSPGKYWGSTMMANSARDPYWKAKVSHETYVLPGNQIEIEDFCTRCHAPQGHFRAKEDGAPHYALADIFGDSLAIDGVSCTACHGMEPLDSIPVFSGNLDYEPNWTVYGPYTDPDTATMWNHINTIPAYSNHILDSELCGRCHTLITETVDLSGNPTGTHFVEQAIYHEWLNSAYALNDSSCQSCHLPQIHDSIILAVEPDYIEPRSPYGKHHLVGGNAFMLKILRDYGDTIGTLAETSQFDTTILLTERQLRHLTLDIELNELSRTADSVFYALELTNKAGHKFPAGYPSRRAYIEFCVLTENYDTLFASGLLDNNYELVGHDAGVEPHYDIISDPNQVQIYEMTMANVNGDFTTVLSQAETTTKDNRLAPQGFLTSHNAYDTIQIVGAAAGDPNFNWENSIEGSGKDVVHYNVAINGYSRTLIVSARVYYQAVPPRWVESLPAGVTPEIELFLALYDSADKTPSLVAEAGFNLGLAVDEISDEDLRVYPNPTSNGRCTVSLPTGMVAEQINIYSASGELVRKFDVKQQSSYTLQLPQSGEVWFIQVILPDGQHLVQKVLSTQ